MHALTIPQHSDPVARIGLIGFVVALIWLAFAPGQPLAQPQTAEAAQPIILVATPTPALPTPPVAERPTVAGGQVETASAAPQTEEPPSALIHNADGSTTLPGSEDWLEPAPVVEVNQAPAPAAIDPEVYKSLPIADEPTESNQQPNYARRPSTGR
jgi:hypothetical protein